MVQRKPQAEKKPPARKRTRKAANAAPPPQGPSLVDVVRVLEQFRAALFASGYSEALPSYQALPEAIHAARQDAQSAHSQTEHIARIQIAAARIAELLADYCQAMVAIAAAARGDVAASPAPAPESVPVPSDPPQANSLRHQVTAILLRSPRGLSLGILADELGMERRALLSQLAPLEAAGAVIIAQVGGRETISLPPTGRRR